MISIASSPSLYVIPTRYEYHYSTLLYIIMSFTT